jgi:hypothetical protein
MPNASENAEAFFRRSFDISLENSRMQAVIDRLVDYWSIQGSLGGPLIARRNPQISAQDAIAHLVAEFSVEQITRSVEEYLFGLVESYDSGFLSYRLSDPKELNRRSRAVMCVALIGESDQLPVSRLLVSELVRSLPVIEWYQSIRTVIARRATATDVLCSLAAGLYSTRIRQICSSAIGLVYYAGYAQASLDSLACECYLISRVRSRLEAVTQRPGLSETRAKTIKAAQRHIGAWQSSI